MHSCPSANIHERSLAEWIAEFPLIAELAAQRETAWFNPAVAPAVEVLANVGLGLADAEAAERRLARFAPLGLRACRAVADEDGQPSAGLRLLTVLRDTQGGCLEPSAIAGAPGPAR